MPRMEIFDMNSAVETLKLLEMAKRERKTKKVSKNKTKVYYMIVNHKLNSVIKSIQQKATWDTVYVPHTQ